MQLLITGGAGYIGSHMVKYAQDNNCEVVVIDNMSTGHKHSIKDCELINVNLVDEEGLSKCLKGRKFDGVIHFAGKSLVGESMQSPEKYYKNNVVGSLNLVNNLIKNEINNIVFSSTAAIFGNPVMNKIAECHPKKPINPYGKTKLIVEEILKDYSLSFGLNATCFRYFNAAGADFSGQIGEEHEPETHLIPNIFKSILSNKNNLKIYGNDYDTPDGTCIRDYVHVNDLAQAHLLGLKKMTNYSGFFEYNLGNSKGFSILNILDECKKISGKEISYEVASRREGDPAILVADSTKAIKELGWKPKYDDIKLILKSAWNWHKKHYSF